jgi:TPR-GreAB-C-PIN type conflict system protein
VLGGLPEEIRTVIRQSLRDSRVPEAVVQDAEFAARDAIPHDPIVERRTVVWDDASGHPLFVETAKSVVADERARVNMIFDLVKTFRRVPNTDSETPSRFDAHVPNLHAPTDLIAASLPATYSVADRTGLPLYSDDRVVRGVAQHEGLDTFGTVALIDALADRGTLTAEQRILARALLRASGGLGIGFEDEDELLGAIDRAHGEPSSELRVGLFDRATWQETIPAFVVSLSIFHHLWESGPDQRFQLWVARFVDAASQARREPVIDSASRILAIALIDYAADFARDLRVALRAWTGLDPLPKAVSAVAELRIGALAHVQPPITFRIPAKVEIADQMLMLGIPDKRYEFWLRKPTR